MERRLINKNIGYRDIVIVSPAEVELKRDLLEAQHKLRTVCPNIWIGITDADSLGFSSTSLCLWTEIDNQPFGPFWFQIKTLKFRNDEIMVSLKCIRHITDAYLEIEPILVGVFPKKNKENSNTKVITSVDSPNETYTDIMCNLKNALSINSVKEFMTFLFAFIIAIFTGSTAFVNFLGNFILALIREMSILIKNSTPMCLGVLDFFSKIIGGFYILIAMFFRPSQPPPKSNRTIAYSDRSYHQSLNSRDID